MSSSATFCNVPLSTSVDSTSEQSFWSLDWVLSSGVAAPGSVASGLLTLLSGNSTPVRSDLPYDLVLARDWLFFCHETLPHVSFALSSGLVTPGTSGNAGHLSSFTDSEPADVQSIDTTSDLQWTPALVQARLHANTCQQLRFTRGKGRGTNRPTFTPTSKTSDLREVDLYLTSKTLEVDPCDLYPDLQGFTLEVAHSK
ncbi:hypothetical protein B0H13DRAFT_1851936 [Mycena leptocephala]|nr:hypothetical protein B0H13DRAFT_1851936 [Mycena leptocephala]